MRKREFCNEISSLYEHRLMRGRKFKKKNFQVKRQTEVAWFLVLLIVCLWYYEFSTVAEYNSLQSHVFAMLGFAREF